jgi:hypothetical protein
MFVLQLKEQGATVTLKPYYPSKTLSEHFDEIDGNKGQNMCDGLKEFYMTKLIPALFHTGFYIQQLADILHGSLRSYLTSLKELPTSKPIKESRYSVQIKRSNQ